MNKLFRLKNRDKKRRRSAPRMRKFLTDHEADGLIPHLYGCVEELKSYFDKMSEVCEKHKGDITFGGALIRVVHDDYVLKKFSGQIPSPAEMANSYFSDVQKMLQENYQLEIDAFLLKHKDFKNYESLAEFVEFAVKLRFITSMILDIREKFLLYSLQTWVAKHDPQDGKLIDLVPTEAGVVAMPLKVIGTNIISVAESIQKNIDQWQNEMLESRGHLLAYKGSQWAAFANILTIITAIAISYLFLKVPSFEEKLEYQETISRLRNEKSNLVAENLKLKRDIENHLNDEHKEKQIKLPKEGL